MDSNLQFRAKWAASRLRLRCAIRGSAAPKQGWPYTSGGPRQISDFSVGRRNGLVGREIKTLLCEGLEVTVVKD